MGEFSISTYLHVFRFDPLSPNHPPPPPPPPSLPPHTHTHTGNTTHMITMEMTTEASSNSSQYYRQAAIITAIVCIVVMTTAVSLVLSLVLCYVCCCRGNRRVRRRTLDVEIAAADSRIGSFGSYGNDCCEAMIPQGMWMTKAFCPASLLGKVDTLSGPMVTCIYKHEKQLAHRQ